MAVRLHAGVNLMPALCHGSLFAQKASLNSASLSPNPASAAPGDIHCFFMAGVDERVDEWVVAKDKRLDALRL